jgi:hypothetical protein
VPATLIATRTLESSLAVWAAVGWAFAGCLWLCACTLNALCRKTRDPIWHVEQSMRRTSGQGRRRRRRRDAALFALSRWTHVGRWGGGWLDRGKWAATGSLAGSVCAIISEVLHR